MTHQPHIAAYEILCDDSPDALSAKVQNAIHDGWQPFGPPAVVLRSDTPAALASYSQAMVRQSDWFR
ncbi:MAG: DUF1737 domain-containing protein [Sedimentitalea sp.]|nr:DUF1737 domain-containing protein [Sedimentitalea sp.]